MRPSIHPDSVTALTPSVLCNSTHSITFHATSSIPSYSSTFQSFPPHSLYFSPFHSNMLRSYPELVSKKEGVTATEMKIIRFFSQEALRLTKFHLIDRFTKPKINLVIYNTYQCVKWNALFKNLNTPGSKTRFGYRVLPISRQVYPEDFFLGDFICEDKIRHFQGIFPMNHEN